jgi:excisionase family DNA binding protein
MNRSVKSNVASVTVSSALKLADLIEEKRRALMVSEVASLLGISERQIYKLAAEHRISHLRFAGSIRFDPRLLATWLRGHVVDVSPGKTRAGTKELSQ